jgi:ATP-dependent Clp protease ATP-binding subunit ClpA
VEKIFDNLISDLGRRLADKGIGVSVTKAAKEHLIKKGYDPKNGARPLRRVIDDEVGSLLSEAIINEKIKKGERSKELEARLKQIVKENSNENNQTVL